MNEMIPVDLPGGGLRTQTEAAHSLARAATGSDITASARRLSAGIRLCRDSLVKRPFTEEADGSAGLHGFSFGFLFGVQRGSWFGGRCCRDNRLRRFLRLHCCGSSGRTRNQGFNLKQRLRYY